jgi:hypothetical protein
VIVEDGWLRADGASLFACIFIGDWWLKRKLVRVLPSLEVKIMDKSIIFIEKQVYKTVTHFGGQIPKGFEVFLRGHPCHIDGQFECDQPQYCSTDFHSAS